MKILSLIAVLLIYALPTVAQTANVHGVVTYFFNDSQGDKPDIGAKVYVIDSAKCKFDKEAAFNYDLASISRQSGDSIFDDADKVNVANNNLIMRSEAVYTATVDGSGNYSFTLKPGTYYIMMQSKGRNHASLSEINGAIYYSIERIHAGQTVDASHNFTLKH